MDNLKDLGHKSHTAKVVLEELSKRERFRDSTDIHRQSLNLKNKGLKIIDDELLDFYKSLEKIGAGVIVYGRHGKSNIFRWHYNLKQVALASLGKEDFETIKTVDQERSNHPAIKYGKSIKKRRNKSEVSKDSTSEKIVYIPLRQNYVFNISIPSDITKNELETICKALKTIA